MTTTGPTIPAWEPLSGSTVAAVCVRAGVTHSPHALRSSHEGFGVLANVANGEINGGVVLDGDVVSSTQLMRVRFRHGVYRGAVLSTDEEEEETNSNRLGIYRLL